MLSLCVSSRRLFILYASCLPLTCLNRILAPLNWYKNHTLLSSTILVLIFLITSLFLSPWGCYKNYTTLFRACQVFFAKFFASCKSNNFQYLWQRKWQNQVKVVKISAMSFLPCRAWLPECLKPPCFSGVTRGCLQTLIGVGRKTITLQVIKYDFF